VGFYRRPHVVTDLAAELRIEHRWKNQESLAVELVNLVC
jgi:hypothetical protein